ncbi:hypothetical protein R5R35_013949 [Gryllus longicercus]|uniref:Uncharacterized protein n=1 Tax=Gryllus longicercus TaxID=2509291 RepID=A0AAN9VNU2_9ORTH
MPSSANSTTTLADPTPLLLPPASPSPPSLATPPLLAPPPPRLLPPLSILRLLPFYHCCLLHYQYHDYLQPFNASIATCTPAFTTAAAISFRSSPCLHQHDHHRSLFHQRRHYRRHHRNRNHQAAATITLTITTTTTAITIVSSTADISPFAVSSTATTTTPPSPPPPPTASRERNEFAAAPARNSNMYPGGASGWCGARGLLFSGAGAAPAISSCGAVVHALPRPPLMHGFPPPRVHCSRAYCVTPMIE